MLGMAHRPFTPRQQAQNRTFLAALRRTGNVRLACRELNVHRATYTKRRKKCAAFATEWDMILVAAHAAFQLAGGERMPAAPGPVAGDCEVEKRTVTGDCPHSERPQSEGLRTKGGEPTIVRLASGRLQLRLAPPGRMTQAAEQAYFAALAASANVRLASAAAGFAHSSFYARRRRWPAFATEHEVALATGYDRLEEVAHACALAAFRGEGPGSAWRYAAETPMPPMSWDQAFQLLCLHRATVRLGWEERTRPIAAPMDTGKAFAALERSLDADGRARHYEATGDWRLPTDPAAPPALPPLGQVTGWSKAAAVKVSYNPDVALFGGWRIGDWKRHRA